MPFLLLVSLALAVAFAVLRPVPPADRELTRPAPPANPAPAPPPPPPPPPPEPPTCGGLPPDARPASALAAVVGVSSHAMWGEDVSPEAELAAMAGCGIRFTREDIRWEVVEPEPGRFDWQRSDALFLAAAGHGIEILGILGHSPAWAGVDGDDSPPANAADYARYAAAVVERYGPRGTFWPETSTFRPLIGVELWNEPWGYWSWRPDPAPARYAQLALAAATAIEEVAPEVTVVVPGDTHQVRRNGSEATWLEHVLGAEPALVPLIDVLSVHPYPDPKGTAPFVERDARRFDYRRVAEVDVVAQRLGARRPVWITEVGWSTASAEGGITEEQQAEYVSRAILRAVDEWPFVERVFVYTWTRDRAREGDIEAGFGLRREDGSAKPALEMLVGLLRG